MRRVRLSRDWLLRRRCPAVRLVPERVGYFEGVDFAGFPPGYFVAGLMKLAVVTAAKRHGELIADLEAERPWLGKAKVMRVGGLAAANKAGLGRYVP
jgi:hypothetical protein